MKRVFDILLSSLGLLLLSPLFFAVAVVIKVQDSGPVFFVQERVGMNFRTFRLYKFRTMLSGTSYAGPPVTTAGDPRITSVGRALRWAKLDELPQLINVLKGDMSLVGPRPELMKYVELFRSEYDKILSIRPGITDFAAIDFRNEEFILNKYQDPEEGYVTEVLPAKIVLYKKYLNEMCFATDLKLIILTILKILRK